MYFLGFIKHDSCHKGAAATVAAPAAAVPTVVNVYVQAGATAYIHPTQFR